MSRRRPVESAARSASLGGTPRPNKTRRRAGLAVSELVIIEPACPPDGTYARWRTFVCRLTDGEPTACGTDGAAVLTAVRWLNLNESEDWDAALRSDPFFYPQIERIRAALGLGGASK